jgi:MFS family permease
MIVIQKKSESSIRWVILFFNCIMMMGEYYSNDIPAALHNQMDEYFGKPGDFENMFALLFTVYAAPSVVLPFFGGYFTDTFGGPMCLIVFTTLITIGQTVFAVGLSLKSWPLMYLGRGIFGMGGPNMCVASSAILSTYFQGKELAFALGLNLSISRLGSVMNNMVTPVLADKIDIQFALWFGVIFCSCSVVCSLIAYTFDKKVEGWIMQNKGAFSILLDSDGELDSDADDTLKISSIHDINAPYGAAGDPSLLAVAAASPRVSVDMIAEPAALLGPGLLLDTTANSSSAGADGAHNPCVQRSRLNSVATRPVEFNDVFKFQHIFWVLTIICVIVYGCVIPFNNIESALLLERDYFKEIPDGCQLLDVNACQSAANYPIHCPSSKWYQPPLPEKVEVDGTWYEPLTESDIDCSDDLWKNGCAKEFCSRQTDAEVQAGQIMSIPYIISACLCPFLGGFVDKYVAWGFVMFFFFFFCYFLFLFFLPCFVVFLYFCDAFFFVFFLCD